MLELKENATHIYKDYYILVDKHNFSLALKPKENKMPSFSFNNKVIPKKKTEDEDLESSYIVLSYHGSFLCCLNALKEHYVRRLALENKINSLNDIKEQTKELKELLASFFNKDDYFYILEMTKHMQVKPFNHKHVIKTRKIDPKNPFSESQIASMKS